MVKNSSNSDIGKKTSKITDNILKNTSTRSGSNKIPVINLDPLKKTIQISSVIKIIIFAIFLTYVLKLEKEHCECSEGWERGYIKYYSLAVIIFGIIQILYTIEYARMSIIHTILGIGGLVFIFSVVKYIKNLKKEDCGCSKSWKRTALNIYAWLSIILLIITFVATLVFLSKISR